MATTPKRYDDEFSPTPPDVEEAEIRYRPRPTPRQALTNQRIVRRLERQLLVEQMLIAGYTRGVITREISARSDCVPQTVLDDINAIHKRWAKEDADAEAYTKPNTIRRILKHIRDAKAQDAWGAVATLERLLAQMQGTLEPSPVNVQFVANQALADYISNLSDDELIALNEEQKELERKAKLFDQSSVIDTEGKDIP